MNDYIVINNKKYQVIVDSYSRSIEPQKTVESGVLGNTIVSSGPGDTNMPGGFVLYIRYSPPSGYGTVEDLRLAAKERIVSFSDHLSDGSWGSGTFNITILSAEINLMSGSSYPENGYLASVSWQKVLS
jgi:hypothetical protein